jgi:hypothetical protein
MKIITREQAALLGLKKFFDGLPCKHGHISERYVNGGCCVKCAVDGGNARYKANPAKAAANGKRWREANPDYAKSWQAANPASGRDAANKRNAKKRENGGSYTYKDIAEIMVMQDGKCAYFHHCGTVLTPQNKEVDHIVPVSAGGSNNPYNIQVVCCACNHSKNTKDPIDYCISVGLLNVSSRIRSMATLPFLRIYGRDGCGLWLPRPFS